MDKCEWCGKKRYSNDDSTWIYDYYDIEGYRNKFWFCCRGHASRFANETNYKPYDDRKICYYCGDKYNLDNGVYWHLRKSGKYRSYHYCSDNCAENHIQSGNYVWVDSNGFTKDEKAHYVRKKRAEIQLQKDREKEMYKTLWYKSVISYITSIFLFLLGVFLICILLPGVFYVMGGIFIFYILYYKNLRSIIKDILGDYFNDDRVLDDGIESSLFEDGIDIFLISIPFYIYDRFYEQIPVLYFTYKLIVITQ